MAAGRTKGRMKVGKFGYVLPSAGDDSRYTLCRSPWCGLQRPCFDNRRTRKELRFDGYASQSIEQIVRITDKGNCAALGNI